MDNMMATAYRTFPLPSCPFSSFLDYPVSSLFLFRKPLLSSPPPSLLFLLVLVLLLLLFLL